MARLLLAVCIGLAAARCGGATPSGSPPAPAPPAETSTTTEAPSPTTGLGIPAPTDVTTAATVSGVIYLGFEACVGLTPGPESRYVPPPGTERDFVLEFPKGWKVVPAHPKNPRYGDQFKILDRTGRVVAEDGDVLEVTGVIKAISATFCGFGWPITVKTATSLSP